MDQFFSQNVIRVKDIPLFMEVLSQVNDVILNDIPTFGAAGRATLLIKLCDMVEYNLQPRPSDEDLKTNREIRNEAVEALVRRMEMFTNNDELVRYLNVARPKSSNRRTALHHATFFRMENTIAFLIGEGCDPSRTTCNLLGDWGGRTALDLALLQKNDTTAQLMVSFLEETNAREQIGQLVSNRDARRHGCKFSFHYAFQNECVKTFKWIVKKVFDFADDNDKERTCMVKEGLERYKLTEHLSHLIQEFLGLWSVAVTAVEALPKKCAWNSVPRRSGNPHTNCKAKTMVQYAKIMVNMYKTPVV